MKTINQPEPDGSKSAAIVSFGDALRVCEGLKQVEDYTEKLAYWDSHPAIFGESGIVIFDTQKKIFESLDAQTDLLGLSDSDIGQYRVFRIEPNGLDEFFPFMEWCIQKSKFWNHYEITDEVYYWKQIKRELFPEEYLSGMLIRAEEIRDCIQSLPNSFGNITVDDKLAKDYFFWYGNQEASKGNMGGFRVEFYLSSVFNKISPRSLSSYGYIFSKFFHGYHTAKMVRFLRDQKKRLDKGEDITVPFLSSDSSTEAPAISTPVAADVQGLTNRERILIHCYELGRVINKGEPDYNDYVTFATPTKRKSYPNNSDSKAKSLIKSIRKIIPHLSQRAVQQANSEIDTIEANLVTR